VAASLDLETISRTVVKSLKDAFNYSHVSIYLLEEEYLNLAAQVGYPEQTAIKKIHISQGVAGRVIRTRVAQFIEGTEKEEVFLRADQNLTSEICIPLLKEDNALGVLNIESGGENRLTQKDVELLTTVAGPIALAVDNARLHAELKKMATTDAVTGLFNRHVFEQAISAEVERAERKGENLSLIIFDIDYFKEYNDTWGHPAGDARLRAVADIIKINLRKYDIAARYGGDEFAIILSDCDRKNALQFAQRLRQGTSQGAPQEPKDGEGVSGYTLSIGIATFPQDATLPSELLIAADHAAMRAKQQGRNRVKFANDYDTA
jgi:diguanylate cyclase (GGDEF)-like protein